MSPHDAGERMTIGHGQCGVTEFGGPHYQLRPMRRGAQERKVRQAMQLGVIGKGIQHDASIKPTVQKPRAGAEVAVEPEMRAGFGFDAVVIAADAWCAPPTSLDSLRPPTANQAMLRCTVAKLAG